MPGCRARSTALCLGLLLSAVSSAFAQATPVPVGLSYEARDAVDCPSEAEFLELVKLRVPGLTRALDARGVHTLRVRLSERDQLFTADLELTDRAGAASTRAVSAASCQEATEAAALIAAVFVSAPLPEPVVPPPPVAAPDSAAPPEEPASWSLSLALRGGVRSALTPGVAPALAASLELGRERSGLWAPSLRVGASYARGSAATSAGRLALSTALGELDVCPLRVPLAGPRWAVRSCAHLEAGKHRGEWRSGPTDARGGPWLAAGLGARLTARLGGCASAELELGASLPLVRNRFVHGEAAVFTAPSAAFAGSVGVGCTIW